MNELPVTYREANMDDLPRLLALEQKVVAAERPFNASITAGRTTYYDTEDLISSNDSYLIVAESANNIIATGYAQIRQSKISLEHDVHSYLGFMYVTPDFRGRGINREITERLIAWSRHRGVTDLYLDVYSENTSAIKAYEKAGFESSLIEMKLSL
jgi:ribosomal protein S18 acetylase RimI-like enzyme